MLINTQPHSFSGSGVMIESDYLYISLAIVFQGILVPQTWISEALSPRLPSNIYLVPYFSNVCGSA